MSFGCLPAATSASKFGGITQCAGRFDLLLYQGDLVTFHYVHGFLDWHDIIYDPSGKLRTLKSWDEKKRFNMYFVSAEHLTGDWYLGHFGD